MPVPDYQTFMLPILRAVANGKQHTRSELLEHLAHEFHLTEDDRAARIPSGSQSLLYSRMHWSLTYLVKAGLLQRPERGAVAITDEGQKVLEGGPTRIDVAFLSRYPSFQEFQERKSERNEGDVIPEPHQFGTDTREPDAERTPTERLFAAYQELREEIAEQILDRLKIGVSLYLSA